MTVQRLTHFVLIALALLAPRSVTAEEIYQAPEQFLAEAFAGASPSPEFLWVKKDMRPTIDKILQHSAFRQLRVRYWRAGMRTVWILNEIGKYQPITTGIIINDEAVERLKVLIYRESHGWEVRHDFFTDQFRGLTLSQKSHRLSDRIDGISGATLSVNALTNLSRLALYFHAAVTHADK